MEITVIIPSHNRAQLLERTLASLARQTRHDFKVLVVDHGSSDETSEVCARYTSLLHLTRCWLARERNAPGLPRHVAMQQVETPLVAFLDCGIVVSSGYIEAHLAFHRQHPRHIGIGLYHGYSATQVQDERWSVLLERMEIDQAPGVLQEQPDLADERWNIHLDGANFVWMYGWTGNLSLPAEEYHAVGGFDLDLEYTFEDIDLSYRLFRNGCAFAIVENGWGIHLPHPRPPQKFLRRVQYLGWEQSYKKLRSLGLEIMFYTALSAKNAEKALHYLVELKRDLAELPSTASLVARYQFARPSLLLGGTLQDAAYYDYLALADERIESTAALWSCSGLRIPLDDQSLQSVVMTDIWKWLDQAFNGRNVWLLECMLAEVKRTASRAFFIDSPGILPQRKACSRVELERLCQRYDLAFEFIEEESKTR